MREVVIRALHSHCRTVALSNALDDDDDDDDSRSDRCSCIPAETLLDLSHIGLGVLLVEVAV